MQDLSVFISQNLLLTYAFAAVLIVLFILELIRAKKGTFRITTHHAVHLINRENAAVIDIRSAEKFREGHILDATSIPGSDLTESAKKLEKYKNKPLIIVCNTGIESQKVAASLLKQGYNAYSLNGGLRAWSEAGLPVVKK